jgi:cation transporter-like permease
MRIGLGVGLLVIGAVLAFAVRDSVPGVSLEIVGYICLGAGALALILGLVENTQRTNTSHRSTIDPDGRGTP